MAYKYNVFTGNLDLVETGIGDTVIGGTNGSVLFIDGGVLAQDPTNLSLTMLPTLYM